MQTNGQNRDIFTVTRLNEAVRDLLEHHFLAVWVEGELSNVAQPGSGHLYFTLKDAQAQVRAAMFKGQARQLRFTPRAGQQVLVRARLSLYAARGDYQLLVEYMEEAGLGALQRAFEALRQQLLLEGLFEAGRKRPLPRFPRHLAVITSPTGAAIRDILSVLRRRYPGLPVTVLPVPVQGAEAAPAIVRAIATANQQDEFDVILVARGGGSLEDLWAFNEAIVARAIAGSRLPVVSGVGHEIDFTIADFAADLRAPTPSAAAELISPSGDELAAQIMARQQQLVSVMSRQLQRASQHLRHCQQRLRDPGRQVRDRQQRVDDLERRLLRATQSTLQRQQQQSTVLHTRLLAHHPQRGLQALSQRLSHAQARQRQLVIQRLERAAAAVQRLDQRLNLLPPTVEPRRTLERLQQRLLAQQPTPALREHRLRLGQMQSRLAAAVAQRIKADGNRLQLLAQRIHSASPLALLARGFAIIEHNDQVVRAAAMLRPGDLITARLGQGRIHAQVLAKEE